MVYFLYEVKMTKKDRLLIKALLNPRYRGKHIIMIKGKIYTAENAKEASLLFDRLTKKFPGHIPTLTYIPKEDALILWLF